MGTRNITRVISDGQVRINQYCQWDGYPTGRGLSVLLFARDLTQNYQIEVLKNYLRTTQLINSDKAALYHRTCTGAPKGSKLKDNLDFVSEYQRCEGVYGCEAVEQLMKKGLLSANEAKEYVVASGDFGSDILKFILKHKPEEMKFYTDDYLSDIPPEGDRQIEAVYLLDLDNKNVQIWWHGTGVSYSFSQLVESTEDNLRNEMRKLETGDIDEGAALECLTKIPMPSDEMQL